MLQHYDQVINVARVLNGPEVASRITLYNYAALDAREWIKLDAQVRCCYTTVAYFIQRYVWHVSCFVVVKVPNVNSISFFP